MATTAHQDRETSRKGRQVVASGKDPPADWMSIFFLVCLVVLLLLPLCSLDLSPYLLVPLSGLQVPTNYLVGKW